MHEEKKEVIRLGRSGQSWGPIHEAGFVPESSP